MLAGEIKFQFSLLTLLVSIVLACLLLWLNTSVEADQWRRSDEDAVSYYGGVTYRVGWPLPYYELDERIAYGGGNDLAIDTVRPNRSTISELFREDDLILTKRRFSYFRVSVDVFVGLLLILTIAWVQESIGRVGHQFKK